MLTACQLDQETELLHDELHHPLRTVHRVFGLHVDVSEKSFQDHSEASICTLCAKLHHPNSKNKKVMNIYSQLSIKSNPFYSFSYLHHNFHCFRSTMRSLFSALFIIGIASAANDTNMLAEQSVVDDVR